MNQPDFSVVVPCFNYGRFLRQCVESIDRQPGVSVEIIIVDDRSTDDSAAVISELATEYDLRTHANPENLGLVGTLNTGLSLAEGEFVLCLSADDFLAPGALARHASAFRRHPNVGMTFGNHVRYKAGDSTPTAAEYFAASLPVGEHIYVHSGDRWLARRCKTGYNPIGAAAVTLRRAVANEVGPYDPRCRHTSDLNMWLRAASVADVAFLGGAPVAYYRKHEISLSAVNFSVRSSDLEQRWIAFQSALEGVGDRQCARRWMAHARRTLAEEATLRARGYLELGLPSESDRLLSIANEISETGSGDSHRSIPAVRTSGKQYLRRARRRTRLWWRRKLLDRTGW